MRYKYTKLEWKTGAKDKIEKAPDLINYAIARYTLDMSASFIPFDTGKLRTSSFAYGVRSTTNGYEIGSATYYARKVWNYNQNTTHWTTPGTGSHWYAVIWNKNKENIKKRAVIKYKLK